MLEGYLQVAPDSTGKKVVMEQIVLADGTTAYRQVAVFGGESAVILQQLLDTSVQQINCLRAILAVLNNSASTSVTEEGL